MAESELGEVMRFLRAVFSVDESHRVFQEDVLRWNPHVIIALKPEGVDALRSEAALRSLTAVSANRIYAAPPLPFGWLDDPPAVNRLLGLRWLVAKLYPQAFPEDLRPLVREFFGTYYQAQLTDAQARSLLGERQ